MYIFHLYGTYLPKSYLFSFIISHEYVYMTCLLSTTADFHDFRTLCTYIFINCNNVTPPYKRSRGSRFIPPLQVYSFEIVHMYTSQHVVTI